MEIVRVINATLAIFKLLLEERQNNRTERLVTLETYLRSQGVRLDYERKKIDEIKNLPDSARTSGRKLRKSQS